MLDRMSDLIRERPRVFREWRHALAPRVFGAEVIQPSPRAVLALAVIAATFMAVTGPFGTWQEPLSERLGFWIIGVGGSVCVGFGLDRCLRRIGLVSSQTYDEGSGKHRAIFRPGVADRLGRGRATAEIPD